MTLCLLLDIAERRVGPARLDDKRDAEFLQDDFGVA